MKISPYFAVIPRGKRKTEEDTLQLQILYQWTITNNMKLNDAKFELLRYGSNAQIKEKPTVLHYQEIKLKQKTLLRILEF